jgi:hypothetical protein
MADTKITALTAITTVDPAVDVLPIVDISDTTMAASGTTKKITSNQILGAGGTATLASATITGAATVGTTLGVTGASTLSSATITGDLTVDTNTLKVDSSNDRVGIGTATPAAKLIVRDGTNRNLLVSSDAAQLGSAGIAIGGFTDNAAGYAPMSLIASAMQFGIGGSTAMTLNASGNVGIGVTPSAWAAGFKAAQVGSRLVLTTTGSDTFFGNNFYNDGAYKFINADYATYYDQTTGKHVWGTSTTSGAVDGVITWNSAMTLDASGRLILLASTTTPATLATNGELTFTATSNTNLRFSYRGSDGTTRVANITLA